jgi:glutamyl-Q tRNA(Asp) synthetase
MVAALASFLEARSRGGEWLVRIEDVDPPREVKGAAAVILTTLERFSLCWDRNVLFQSTRRRRYDEIAQSLLRDAAAYRCSCTRAELRDPGGTGSEPAPYPGLCRTREIHERTTAIRVRVDGGAIEFTDALQGTQRQRIQSVSGDYVIFRRDGLPAYHLAVVVDDAEQGVTDVVRGVDLLDSTAAHIHLQRTLRLPTPSYAHIPLIVDERGQKLSKQSAAAPIYSGNADAVAPLLLEYLGLPPPQPLRGAPPRELWAWALAEWDITRFRGKTRLPERSVPA